MKKEWLQDDFFIVNLLYYVYLYYYVCSSMYSSRSYLNGEIRDLKPMLDSCQAQVSAVVIHEHSSGVEGGQGVPQERVD